VSDEIIRRVPVGVGHPAYGDRAYEVLIGPGLLRRAGALLTDVLPRRRTVVVTDETVAGLHGDTVLAALADAGIAARLIDLPPGEQTKSFEGVADLCDRLLAETLDRGDVITALGGGVIGDLTGFAAAIYKRGIDFVQLPTTLLAQVDSSVGGKTAIDTPRGKNLIGAFHQPRRVVADIDVLGTLPVRELRAGYAEVLKYGLLGDRGFFEGLEARGAAVLAGDPDALAWAVEHSVRMKAQIVAEDERETGRRALLNLGHTFGHALEAETGFGGDLLHGEGVGAGMALAFRYSAYLGLCSGQDAARAVRAIAAADLPTTLAEIPGAPFRREALVAHMRQDKKAESGAITLILARGLGEAFVEKGSPVAPLEAFLEAEGAV
jgi:3-dehydroquinate synthase